MNPRSYNLLFLIFFLFIGIYLLILSVFFPLTPTAAAEREASMASYTNYSVPYFTRRTTIETESEITADLLETNSATNRAALSGSEIAQRLIDDAEKIYTDGRVSENLNLFADDFSRAIKSESYLSAVQILMKAPESGEIEANDLSVDFQMDDNRFEELSRALLERSLWASLDAQSFILNRDGFYFSEQNDLKRFQMAVFSAKILTDYFYEFSERADDFNLAAFYQMIGQVTRSATEASKNASLENEYAFLMGRLYFGVENFEESLFSLLSAQTYFQKNADFKSLLNSGLFEIAVHLYLDEYDDAVEVAQSLSEMVDAYLPDESRRDFWLSEAEVGIRFFSESYLCPKEIYYCAGLLFRESYPLKTMDYMALYLNEGTNQSYLAGAHAVMSEVKSGEI